MERKRVLFPFVEAGLGHIMPMKAVCDVFEQKYGGNDGVEIIKTNFFSDTEDAEMKSIQDDFVREVKLHNRYRGRGSLEFLIMKIFGSKTTLRFLMEKRYKRGLAQSLQYMNDLKPDLVFNTHFSTQYYACKLKEEGKLNCDVVTYCPDPIIGRQWDRRTDLIALSSDRGRSKALRSGGGYKARQVKVVPFLIRKDVEQYGEDKGFYRRQLGLPEDRFTILLADGAYGAGRLEKTVKLFLKKGRKLNVIAVCGKNEELYRRLKDIVPPSDVCFLPVGFTDKMLVLSAACDLFIGKAGASNLAEPCYFGAPQIINFCATPIEKWIAAHYVKSVKSAVRVHSARSAVKTALKWAADRRIMDRYRENCISQHRCDGAEILADIIWGRLNGEV